MEIVCAPAAQAKTQEPGGNLLRALIVRYGRGIFAPVAIDDRHALLRRQCDR
jgi:hypothetical protein